MERSLPEGYQLFEYVIVSELGMGGFGITYLAEDRNLHTQVAIKEYFPNACSYRNDQREVVPLNEANVDSYQWGLESFLKEARTLASFKHANIVRVLRFFELNNTAYMVMEFEQGHSLKQYVKEGNALDEKAVIDMFIPLCKGLAVVHSKKFLHRDIKPDNILVRDDQSMVLLDFGSARLSTDEQNESDGLTSIVSPGYAPLEQYDRHGKQGPWSDIYALGGVLYWLVTGKAPEQSLYRMSEDPVVPAQTCGQESFSQQFLKAIDWSLSVEADKRPQNLAEFIKAMSGQQIDLSSNSPDIIYSQESAQGKMNWVLPVLVSIMLTIVSAGGLYYYWQYIHQTDLQAPALHQIAEGKIEWQRTIGGEKDDQMVSMESLADGSMIGVGWSMSEGKGATQVFAVKLDKMGQQLWKKNYPSEGKARPEDIKILKDGTGALISGTQFSRSTGSKDIWVFRINNDGDLIWENVFGGNYDEAPGDIHELEGGRYLIAALTQSKGAGSEDIWFFEANSKGEIIKEKTFGGSMSDIPDDFKVLEDGSYLMTGWQDSKGAGGFDAWMIKLSPEGEKLWGKTYGDTGDDIIETMHVVDDGLFLAGRTDSKGKGGGTDAWLMKVDFEGEVIWEKTYGWDKYDDFRDIENAADGSLIVTGITHSMGKGSSDIWVMKMDLSGQVSWVKTFGGKNREEISDFEVEQNSQEGLIFSASTRSQGNGGWDGWIFKANSNEPGAEKGQF